MQHFWYTSIASINFCLKYLTMTVEKDLMKRFLNYYYFCFVLFLYFLWSILKVC